MLFVCDNCLCLENTALGAFNNKKRHWRILGEHYRDKVLCSECAPPHFKNGKETRWGVWHNQFDKTEATKEILKAMTGNGTLAISNGYHKVMRG